MSAPHSLECLGHDAVEALRLGELVPLVPEVHIVLAEVLPIEERHDKTIGRPESSASAPVSKDSR